MTILKTLHADAAAIAGLSIATALVTGASAQAGSTQGVNNVVLVHGAWADGSSWDGVISRLQRAGYTVLAPPNPLRGVDSQHSRQQSGGNMEGKEVRFGIAGSALTAVVTSNTATGSNNSMHDSYTSLGGLVLLANLLLGEVVFGGLGTGLMGMVMAAAIARSSLPSVMLVTNERSIFSRSTEKLRRRPKLE